MISHPETGWTEATITINGDPLTFAESMTVRVALSSFAMFVAAPEHREQLGPIAENYAAHLDAIMRKLVRP